MGKEGDCSSLFGSSSDDEFLDQCIDGKAIAVEFDNIFNGSSKLPKGLILLSGALSPESISFIKSQIPKTHNQHVYFTHLPPFLGIFSSIAAPYLDRLPIFDQAVINKYSAGDSLKSHVDLLRFKDGILICNLVGSVDFEFQKDSGTENCSNSTSIDTYSVSLTDGDCLILTGDSRYRWKHGFNNLENDRISITMRRMELNAYGISI